jgi:hypothetical protein
MSKNGQGPRLLGRFTNGRVEEFIHARVIRYLLIFYFSTVVYYSNQHLENCYISLMIKNCKKDAL